ncbi:MAG: metallophosphoesterase [Planctomycetaceae bacterium]
MTQRVLHLTDFHVFTDKSTTLKGIPTRESLLWVLEHIRQTEPRFDQVIITGDHTHDELESTYEDVKDILKDWLPILKTVPGNHDDPALLRKVFENQFSNHEELTFSIPLGQWQLIGLNSHCPGEVHGTISSSQLEWLQRETSASDRPTGLFFHHPPMNVGGNWMDSLLLTNAAEVQATLRSIPNLKFVCCGHVHHEFALKLGDVDVFTTPSTGIQFDPSTPEPGFLAAPPGYRVFEFDRTDFTTFVKRMPKIRFRPDAS